MNLFMVGDPYTPVADASEAARIYQTEGADWCWSTHAPADGILRSRRTGSHLLRVTPVGVTWYAQGGPDLDGSGLGVWYGEVSESEAEARRRAEQWLRNTKGATHDYTGTVN